MRLAAPNNCHMMVHAISQEFRGTGNKTMLILEGRQVEGQGSQVLVKNDRPQCINTEAYNATFLHTFFTHIFTHIFHTIFVHSLPLDAIAVSFPMAQFSVVEEDMNLTVCVQLSAGPYSKERNVSLTIFSTEGTAAGMMVPM